MYEMSNDVTEVSILFGGVLDLNGADVTVGARE